MNMMDKFNCDIMNVNDMHEKQNDNFDTFEKRRDALKYVIKNI